MEVLHTCGQTLVYHPHIHTIVPAGGIDKQEKLKREKITKKYIKIYRQKFCHELLTDKKYNKSY